jgi:TPR repeat protein/serine/threonine protein kinase
MPASPCSDSLPQGQALPPGTRLEEFVIEKVLGSGGFGITYLARDSRLGRQVVIKENLPAQFCFRDPSSLTVSPRHSQGEDAENFAYSLESFEKEAAMLASLDHPGIVKVLRSFEAHGTAYFVMPFVEGTALDDLLKQGKRFGQQELQSLLQKLLAALGYLHERGIYHRDIKPGNILIMAATGEPVLIDFGAARQRLGEKSLTVIESAGYTPFEQLQTRGKVGPWSDIYALGATLCKLLTGETPPKAADRVLEDPMGALGERPEILERYSRRLLESIDKAMSPRAGDRFQDAVEWRDWVWESGRRAEGPAKTVKKESPAKKELVKAPPAAKSSKTKPKIINLRREVSSLDEGITIEAPKKPVLQANFLKKQRQRLVELRDAYMNSAEGVASESLRSHEGGEASALGMHQADAGSDAYDRDFALRLLAKEQDAIYEINEALNRIDKGTYGICEMSGDLIPEERLEALPFTRFTVACQARIERDQHGGRWTRPVSSLFDLDESAEGLAPAQYHLGVKYDKGQGVPRDVAEAVKWYRKAADQRHADAQCILGIKYSKGEGVPKDDAEAVKWYRKAADQGHDRAQCILGLLYAIGQGVTKDPSEAVKWYRKAADQGNAGAQYHLGVKYDKGQGVPGDVAEAVKWYRKAADQGHARAQFNLALKYDNGQGVPKNDAEAIKWYLNAADKGHAEAQYNSGLKYANGQGVPQDLSEAVKWYGKAADQGHATAQYELGLINEKIFNDGKSSSFREALDWYLKSATNGNIYAQHKLGIIYEHGVRWAIPRSTHLGTYSLRVGMAIEKDMSESAKWYQKAAEQGHVESQNKIGEMYDKGEGVNQDHNEAVKWYKKAASDGNANAQNNLGCKYDRGQIMDKSPSMQAAKWFLEAAKQGHVLAQFNIGLKYDKGDGVPRDVNEATKWFQKAAAKGHRASADKITPAAILIRKTKSLLT